MDRICRRALLVLALQLLPLSARSQGVSEVSSRNRFELDYEPIVGCPSYDDALAAITRRAKSAATAVHSGLVFEFQPLENGREGRLVIREAGMRPRERRIHAENCAELIDAMALIATVVLERTERVPAEQNPSPREAVASYPAASGQSRVAETRAARSAPGTAHGSATAQSAREPAPAATETFGSLHPGLGVGVRYNSTVAPDGILAEAAFAELAWAHTTVVGLELRLELVHGSSRTTKTDQGDARFTWTTGRLLVCPVSAEGAEPLEVGLCATGEVGNLAVGVPRAANGPRPARVLWRAIGVSLRAALGWEPLRLEAEAGLEAPLLRDSFFFASETQRTEVHRIPAAGLGAGLSLGARF